MTASSRSLAIAQGPCISRRASASGPTTAILRRSAGKGSAPSLVSTTIERRAASRASSRAGVAGSRAAALLLLRRNIVEQAKALLQRQHAANAGIDVRDRHAPLGERLRQALAKAAAHHVDIDARFKRQRGGLAKICGDAMAQQFRDRIVIADDDALEIPARRAASRDSKA